MDFAASGTVEGLDDETLETTSGIPAGSNPEREATSLLARLRPHGKPQCRVVSRAELQGCPVWRSTFAASRKDHRYYEILEDTVQDRFDYKYFLITDERGETLAVQPFFVMDQDMLEGVACLSRAMTSIRKYFPRFLMMRTLMVGCTAGEGHLAASPRLSAAEIGKTLAANIVRHAKALKASMVVMKEFPAKYREALDPLLGTGFARVPSMPAVALDVAHSSFDEFMQKALRANARRHLKKNLAASKGAGITMQVVTDPGLVLDDIHRLYLQVFEKSEFRFEKLTPDYFRQIAAQMGDKARFFTWRRDGELIACSLSMVEGRTLCLEYLGLDYNVAHDLHLYHYTFRDQYNWAVQNGMTKIWSSALGYDPKLHLRFTLDPLDLYVQHVQPLMNAGLQRVLKWMVPARYDETLKKFPNYAEIW
jgi:predicted N-acyltransferase